MRMAAWARSACASTFILHPSAFLLETSSGLRSRQVDVGEEERHGAVYGKFKRPFRRVWRVRGGRASAGWTNGSGSFPGSDFGRPRGPTCIDLLNQRFDPLAKSLAATTLLFLRVQARSVDVVDAGVDDRLPSPRRLRGAKSAPHPALRPTFSPRCGRRETDSLIVGVRSCGVEATSPGVGAR